MPLICRICGKTDSHPSFECREKMFGWGDSFLYFQCVQCGCLQISNVPPDLGRYYPAQYYSYHPRSVARGGWKARLAARRDYSMATNRGLLGKLVHRFMPAQESLVPLGRIPAKPEMRILDVGCGSGLLLAYLDRAGFTSLSGIDPYLAADLQATPRVRVRNLALEQVTEKFDLIMLHHVFEHIEAGGPLLANCLDRLAPGGKVLLRIPVADSQAWEEYRENWVGLDAPRHIFLHTRQSLELLAQKSGFDVEQWFCDSTAMQFWASELYRHGRPLQEPDGTPVNPAAHFARAELRDFAKRAAQLNRASRGDQAVAILRASR